MQAYRTFRYVVPHLRQRTRFNVTLQVTRVQRVAVRWCWWNQSSKPVTTRLTVDNVTYSCEGPWMTVPLVTTSLASSAPLPLYMSCHPSNSTDCRKKRYSFFWRLLYDPPIISEYVTWGGGGRVVGTQTGLQNGQPTKRGLTPSRGKRLFLITYAVQQDTQLLLWLNIYSQYVWQLEMFRA